MNRGSGPSDGTESGPGPIAGSSSSARRSSASVAEDAATRAIHSSLALNHNSSPTSSGGIPTPPPDFNPEPDYPPPSPHHGVIPSPASSTASSTESPVRRQQSGELFANHIVSSSDEGGRSALRSERSYSSLDGDPWRGSEASETLNEARENLLQEEVEWEREIENAKSSKSSGSGSRRHSDDTVTDDDDETRHAWDSVWPSQEIIAQHAESPPMRRTSRGEYEPVSSTMSPPHSPTQRLFAFPSSQGSGSSAGSSGSSKTINANQMNSASPNLRPISSSPTALRPQGFTHRRIMSQDREREKRKVLDHDFNAPSAGESSAVASITEQDETSSSPPPFSQMLHDRRRRSSSVSAVLVRPSSSTLSQPIDGSSAPPPISLPPSIATAPAPPSTPPLEVAPAALPNPPTPPSDRAGMPPALRRANSATDSRTFRTSSPSLQRHLSLTGKSSPKRSPSVLEADENPIARKSPKRSPDTLPMIITKSPPFNEQPWETVRTEESGSAFKLIEDPIEATRRRREAKKSPGLSPETKRQPDSPASPSTSEVPAGLHLELPDDGPAPVNISPPVDSYGISPPLLDENGEARPVMEPAMDVSFDDEGLNTLERIFLLSKSDYPFHRAYVARSLGDLLLDVDPCETVEYVMPLLSGFTMDNDESVKEAFASEIHRILWFFFATCRLISEDDMDAEEPEEDPETTTVTMTSAGPTVVPATAAVRTDIDSAAWHGYDEDGTPEASTAGSTISGSSIQTPSSTGILSPDDLDTAKPSPHLQEEIAPIISRPSIPVQYFTPILGSMLLSQNNMVADPARAAVVAIIARLQGKEQAGIDPWGPARTDDLRRAYASQTGPHVHDRHPFSDASKQMVERELVQGIVLGMGKLDTDLPEQGYPTASHSDPGDYKADIEHDDDGYPLLDDEDETAQYKYQLEQEATLGRAISINLIASISEFYTGTEIADRGFIDPVLKSAGDELGVKTEAALALAYLAKVAPVKYIDDMLPLFEHFATDDAVHVKQSACLCLPALCRRIESMELRRTYAVNAISLLMESDKAVQLTVLEVLGEIIHLFIDDPQGPPEELLEFFLAEEEPEEPNGWITIPAESERDIVTAFNFPAVALTLCGGRWQELRSRYLQLATSGQNKVKRSLAASLHEMARILNPEDVGRDLVPFFKDCLASTEDIRERVFDHLDIFIEQSPLDVGWDLCECLARSWSAGTLGSWRIRERLAGHLPALFTLFHSQPNSALILDVVNEALKDPFAAVRDAATKGVSALHVAASGYEDRIVQLRTILLDLGNSSSFRQRQTFIRCVQNFIDPPPNKSAFEEYFLPALPRLLNDVIDIRIALAKLLQSLFLHDAFYGNDDTPVPDSVVGLAKSLVEDEHVDVRYLALTLPFFRSHQSPPPHGTIDRRASTGVTDMFSSQLRLRSTPKTDAPSANPFADSFSEAVNSPP